MWKQPSTSWFPTESPSESIQPTENRSSSPSISVSPTSNPSDEPSVSVMPSDLPSNKPSETPSDEPSNVPSKTPSDEPSVSVMPSDLPSNKPSETPSDEPSNAPSDELTPGPTIKLITQRDDITLIIEDNNSNPIARTTSMLSYVNTTPDTLLDTGIDFQLQDGTVAFQPTPSETAIGTTTVIAPSDTIIIEGGSYRPSEAEVLALSVSTNGLTDVNLVTIEEGAKAIFNGGGVFDGTNLETLESASSINAGVGLNLEKTAVVTVCPGSYFKGGRNALNRDGRHGAVVGPGATLQLVDATIEGGDSYSSGPGGNGLRLIIPEPVPAVGTQVQQVTITGSATSVKGGRKSAGDRSTTIEVGWGNLRIYDGTFGDSATLYSLNVNAAVGAAEVHIYGGQWYGKWAVSRDAVYVYGNDLTFTSTTASTGTIQGTLCGGTESISQGVEKFLGGQVILEPCPDPYDPPNSFPECS